MTIIGTCSICGGPVTVPDLWGGVVPPIPTCSQCGAVKAGHGPVIEMVKPFPAPKISDLYWNSKMGRPEVKP